MILLDCFVYSQCVETKLVVYTDLVSSKIAGPLFFLIIEI